MTSDSNKKRNINLPYQEGKSLAKLATEYMLDPKTMGALVIEGNLSSVSNQIEFEYAKGVIEQGVEEIRRGNLSKLEEMLYSQAVALNMMFTSLSRKASIQTNADIRATITNLALKSQNQSRNTIQTLINLKQPNQTAFIKQQMNVANGHQQINNGVAQPSPEKFSNVRNELLEEKNGEWLDRGTKAKTKGVNTELEAVGKVYRGKNSTRKGKV
jgi:hypothetical protein